MHMPGAMGILLIVIVLLLLFGPNKLPELGRAFGKTLREFKIGAKDLMGDDEQQKDTQQSLRKEIPAEQVRVHEAPKAEASRTEAHGAEETPQSRPDNRRLPD